MVKPKCKKNFKEMQLKKLLPESKYPLVNFSPLLQWKVVATRFFGGVLATAATTGCAKYVNAASNGQSGGFL